MLVILEVTKRPNRTSARLRQKCVILRFLPSLILSWISHHYEALDVPYDVLFKQNCNCMRRLNEGPRIVSTRKDAKFILRLI